MARRISRKSELETKKKRTSLLEKSLKAAKQLYQERESNPYGLSGHKILSLACLPVPPSRLHLYPCGVDVIIDTCLRQFDIHSSAFFIHHSMKKMSNVEYRISNVEYRMSNVEYRMSNIECRIEKYSIFPETTKPFFKGFFERETRFELATPTLARSCSTN
jgi:hypothetical protein